MLVVQYDKLDAVSIGVYGYDDRSMNHFYGATLHIAILNIENCIRWNK